MGKKFPYEIMEDQKELAKFGFCKEEIYCDLIACQKGQMAKDEFKSKYLTKAAILCLDMTGFSETAMVSIGYGEVYAIGIDQAMGDEMNRACKLGEDIARGFETLITECAYDALKERNDCKIENRIHEEIPFAFYEVRTGKHLVWRYFRAGLRTNEISKSSAEKN